MTFRIVSHPTSEPITLAEARLHLRVVPDEDSPPAHPDDPLILALISASREYCEHFMARAIAPQTVEVTLDAFPASTVDLPMGPIGGLTSIKYFDEDEVEQTLAASLYTFDSYRSPGRILLTPDSTWPATQVVPNAVRIRYEVGYSLPGDSPDDRPLPFSIRAAMLLVLGHLYEHREQTTDLNLIELPLGVQSLLIPYQLRMSMA